MKGVRRTALKLTEMRAQANGERDGWDQLMQSLAGKEFGGWCKHR